MSINRLQRPQLVVIGNGMAGMRTVETLAMNVPREPVRNAIKSMGLDAGDWPASRISQAAKELLESQGEDGKILQTARKQIEAERDTAQHQRG
jgi:hypothetical protein